MDHSEEDYKQKIPLRMADGAFNSDLEGIIDAIYELQQKFEIDTSLKIVSFCKLGEFGITNDILQLFGRVKECDTKLQKIGDVDVTLLGDPIKLRKSNTQVFESHACDDEKTIFNMSYDDHLDIFASEVGCDGFGVCDPSVRVVAWEGIKTTENRVRGIKAGYNVDLILVGAYVPPLMDKIAALPGDEIAKLDRSIYSISANRYSRVLYNASRKMPKDVYDVAFGDVDYSSSNFEEVG